MILTNEIMELGKSARGAWSHRQLKLLGVKPNQNKLPSGWKRKVIGRDYDEEVIAEFIALKDVHLVVKEIFSDKPTFQEKVARKRQIRDEKRALKRQQRKI